MTELGQEFVNKLASDDEFRARVVEVLRQASKVADGSFGEEPFSFSTEFEWAAAEHKLAAELKGFAGALCDHQRVQEHRCEYCDNVIYPTVAIR